MRAIAAAVVAALLLFWPVSTRAWGLDVHRMITKRAIAGLPVGLRAFYTARADFISEHAVDPDMWRLVGLKGELGEEDPNHFLDIDGLGDPRPFKGVPRDWNAYVAKYGAELANRTGRVPWRAEEIYKKLVERFQEAAKNPNGFGAENAAYLSAIISHYIEDAHQPFHSVASYDGQATNQRGIHARFENDLVLRNVATLKLAPVVIHPVPNVKDFIFDALISGEALVQSILDADKKAIEGREFYDDVYFATFLKGTRAAVERRMSEAASGVASVITAAWTEAGKPALPVKRTAAPVRIRR
ncbi:MAG TPA: hypothetical protein VN700_12845 [Vicinamibacterales bacterium]|nr:hypothetical protein [Vicinamibacterales bacterium]